MTLFTKQEKLVLKFLGLSLVAGLVIGGLRHLGVFQEGTDLPLTTEITTFNELSTQSEGAGQSKSLSISRKTNESNPTTAVKLVDINTANKAELMTIPAIGPVTAERILRYRQDFGPFIQIEELGRVKGIGAKTLEKIRPYITPLN
ncbi:MAG: ComEA family DNA-binding protein [Fidelibacterota bacterium]